MEDFEYSVEICDRDWECFFAECEDSNLLPPSLAGVDDSGMSDIDETGSLLGRRLHEIDQTAGLLEADRSIDGPPECEGPPMGRYLGKHAVAGMESVLSGSEEDIHLQSVNVFFERLNHFTGSERLAEPSRVRDVKYREAAGEEEPVSDGKRASWSNWPKNKCLSASGETAVCKDTAQPVETTSEINTVKRCVLGADMAPQPADSNFVLQTHKSAEPETRFLSREELRTETRVSEATHLYQCGDSPEGGVLSETTTVETCTSLQDGDQEDLVKSQVSISKKRLTDSLSNLETATHVGRKGNQSAEGVQMDATRTHKTSSQESSPPASIKRKRRKKRRLSVESAERGHGYERQVLVKQSDSEEERCAWRRATGLSEDLKLSYLTRPQKECISLLPLRPNLKNIKIDSVDQYSRNQCLPDSILTKGRRKETELAENNVTNDLSINPSSQTDNSATSAARNNGKVGKKLQQNIKLHTEEVSGWPGVITDSVTAKTETAKKGRNDTHAGSLKQSDKMNQSVICCEDERNPESCTAQVKSIRILSNDPVGVRQRGKRSAANSVLAVEAGHSGTDEHILRGGEAEPQQQLEIDPHDKHWDTSTRERPQRPLSASTSDDTKPKGFKTRFCPVQSSNVGCAKSPSDTSCALPNKHVWAKSPTSFAIDFTPQRTELSLVSHTLSKLQVFAEKNTTAAVADFAASQTTSSHGGDPLVCGESVVESRRETRPSTSEDLPTRPTDIEPVSSCCTTDTLSASNENTTDTSGGSFSSVRQNHLGDRRETPPTTAGRRHEGVGPSEDQRQAATNDTTDSKCEDVIAASEAEREPQKGPDSKHSVFAMSSFWREMEMLTIDDILGLRMISKAAPWSSLSPIQESEETRRFAITDSSFFPRLEEAMTSKDPSDPNSTETSSASAVADSPSPSRGVQWENMTSTSQPVPSEGAQTKIFKNVSVRNLHALQADSRKVQTLQAVDEGGLLKEERFTDAHMAEQEKASLATESYGSSLTDIFQYLFRGKESVPSQSVTDNITTIFTDGNSVPETYDHFFSDFDTESFFYPLVPAEDQAGGQLVPVFSYSNRNVQFPEAYEHFFASSSDESSESDEDGAGPVRVVTRFDHASSAPPTDVYENFFTDSDLRQNFFWKSTLSFRNMTLTGCGGQKQTLTNPPARVAVSKSGRSTGRTLHPLPALANQPGKFPDKVLYQRPFRCEDLQAVVSNPRLDGSLLPLRQSDMCLVCIAFASWVLKTANPQVGDTWKAGL
ncbi:uncharacterized protein perm1a isoform 2-T2 [Spinachia spinachia]